MLAITFTPDGAIALVERPTPEPGPARVRVRVRAAGLNRADLLQRRGGYPAPPGWPPDIPGLEYAGLVEALGPGTTGTGWSPGDRVMGLVGGGAQAEFVVVNADEMLPAPAGLSFEEAAAIPEAFLTAWDALVARGRTAPGERVLIHAIGSGVGTAAVQLVRGLGAEPVGTARSAWKLERAMPLGLAEGIDTRQGSFRERLRAPVDVILDVLGGAAFADNLASLAPRGRLVLLGLLQGADAEAPLELVLRRRLEVIGTVMRTRSAEERADLVREFRTRVLDGFSADADRRLMPVLGGVWPMTDLAAAHTALERNTIFGKAVVTW
ncbi:MAG: NAD(P)H-quinone oxidoreductase [Gemmatimonadales bacterium]